MHGSVRPLSLALALVAAAFAGCVGPQEAASASGCPEEGWDRHADAEAGFSTCHPSDWITQTDLMGLDLVLFPPDERSDDFGSNVNVLHRELPEEMTATEVLGEQPEMLREMITGFELVESTTVEIGDRSAHRIVYTGEQGIHELRWSQWAIADGTSLLLLTYTTEQAEDPIGDETLETMLATTHPLDEGEVLKS